MQAFDCTSLLHVLQTEELLVKRRALLEKKIAQELDKAKTYTKAQNKRGKQPGTRQKMHLLMISWGWCKGNATINTALACKLLETKPSVYGDYGRFTGAHSPGTHQLSAA